MKEAELPAVKGNLRAGKYYFVRLIYKFISKNNKSIILICKIKHERT